MAIATNVLVVVGMLAWCAPTRSKRSAFVLSGFSGMRRGLTFLKCIAVEEALRGELNPIVGSSTKRSTWFVLWTTRTSIEPPAVIFARVKNPRASNPLRPFPFWVNLETE